MVWPRSGITPSSHCWTFSPISKMLEPSNSLQPFSTPDSSDPGVTKALWLWHGTRWPRSTKGTGSPKGAPIGKNIPPAVGPLPSPLLAEEAWEPKVLSRKSCSRAAFRACRAAVGPSSPELYLGVGASSTCSLLSLCLASGLGSLSSSPVELTEARPWPSAQPSRLLPTRFSALPARPFRR